MSEKTTQSIRQAEQKLVGEFKALGPLPNFTGDEIIVMRCAETMPEVFPDWLNRSELDEKRYVPFDLNVPIELPIRAQMRKSYEIDPPITEAGKVCARMTARELKQRKMIPKTIFCSPDFASVETAAQIAARLGETCGKIRIEPELSSFLKGNEFFFKKDELKGLGYPLDDVTPFSASKTSTTYAETVNRIKKVFYELIAPVPNALIIVDPLSMMIISSFFYPIKLKKESSIELERLKSLDSVGSLANFAIFRQGVTGMKMYDLTNVTLRPLTFTGFSNDIEFD